MLNHCFLIFLMVLLPLDLSAQIPEKWSLFLSELVETNSGTHNLEGLEAIRMKLIPKFQTLGFEAETIDAGEGRKVLFLRHKDVTPKVLMIGHIDTVFDKTSPFQKFSEGAGKFHGPGVNDMKGGLVMMLMVLETIKEPELLRQIGVVLNDDEEIGSPMSASILKKLAKDVPYGLVYEPTLTSAEHVTTTQAGGLWFELIVKGQASHAGAEHANGINACVELSHKIIQMARLTNYKRKLTVNPGVIKGGTKPNVVCEEASVQVDLRYVNENDLDAAKKEILEIANKSTIFNVTLKRGTAGIVTEILHIPSLTAKSTSFLFKRAQKVGKSLGMKLKQEHMGGISDANQLASTGMKLLGGLGPWGKGAHSTDEMVDAQSWDKRMQLNVGLIKDLLK